jgi:hypothetical protein
MLDITPCAIVYVVIFRTNSPEETSMWKKSSIKTYIISQWEMRTILWELDLFSSSGNMVGRHVDSWVEQKEIFLIALGRAGMLSDSLPSYLRMGKDQVPNTLCFF